MKQVAAILAFVAGYSKDRVGLILYSDVVECLVPPAMGHTHVHTVLEHIFSHKASSVLTNGTVALNKLKQMRSRDTAVFLISDCIDEQLGKSLNLASRMNEVVVVRCLDHLERNLPQVGFLPVKDPETGLECVLDTRSHNSISAYLNQRAIEQQRLFSKYGIDCLDLVNNETFIGDVIRFFRHRMTY
jgi:uncharacterized protein (DUF58 family)